MKFTTLSLLPILALTAACGGSGSTDTGREDEVALVALPADGEILTKAYNTDYSVPDGFFVDERATTTRSYTVHHVLDTSASFEMCTEDLVEAQAWEAADHESRAVNGHFVTSHENDRYFEFVRELAYNDDVGNVSSSTSPGYARIFKCRHTNRDGVDRALVDGYAGKLNPANLGAGALRDFTEYLWQFAFFNAKHKKVLASYSDANGMQHTLLLAFVLNQGTDACDRVDVVEWRFVADPESGEITRAFDTLQSFEATLDAGQPRLCE